MLDLELIHDSPEGLFKLVDLLIEFLSHLHLKLIIQVFIDSDTLIVFIDLKNHLLNHLLHFLDLWGDLDNVVLHLSVLQNTLGAEHGPIVLAVELYFFLWMDLAISDRSRWLVLRVRFFALRIVVLHPHWQRCQHLVVNGQIFGLLVVRDLVVWAFDHLVLVELAGTLEAEGVAARQGDWFLVVVVVWLETNATFKNLIHLSGLLGLVVIL